MQTFILGSIFVMALLIGGVVGWIVQAMFTAYLNHERHDFEELFENNPHPELFNEKGEIYRGDYMNVTFEPGYDPEDFDPEDVKLDE